MGLIRAERYLAEPVIGDQWYFNLDDNIPIDDELFAKMLADEWDVPLGLADVVVASFVTDDERDEAIDMITGYVEEENVDLFEITAPEIIQLLCQYYPDQANQIRARNTLYTTVH